MTDKKNIREKIQNLTDIELRVLEVAKDEFEKSGYYVTNIEDIAEKVNIGKATIYRHFGNKSDLFFYTLVLSLYEYFNKFVEIKEIEDPYEALNFCITLSFAAIDKIQTFKLKNSLMAQAMGIDNVQENVIKYFEEIRIKIVDEFEKLISSCLQKSDISVEGARNISDYIVTTLSLYIHMKVGYEDNIKKSFIEDINDIKRFIFRGIGMSNENIIKLTNDD